MNYRVHGNYENTHRGKAHLELDTSLLLLGKLGGAGLGFTLPPGQLDSQWLRL